MSALPPEVAAAVNLLADYAVSLYPDVDDPERLGAWVAGAIEAQVTDPDFEQAREVELLRDERARLWDQLQALGGRGVELAERIDEIDRLMGEA